MPGRLGEAAPPGNGKRRISLRAPEKQRVEEKCDSTFRESANPMAVREVGGLAPSEGLPGYELLELLEFTRREVEDAAESMQQQLAEHSDADPSAKIRVMQKLRAARRDLEKRVIVRIDIARLQFEELAQKEARPVVEGISKRCVVMDQEIKQLLDQLSTLLET